VWPVCRLAAEERRRVYFLGGEEGVPGEAARVIKDAIPNFQLAGFYSPPFGFEKDDVENQKIVEMINKSRADVIFVALGAPKQEKWVAKHLNQLDIKVAVCVGAGLDFIAGTIKRAPKWVQKSGFEWAWRLTRDPKRLWKRYLVEDTAFLGIFFREWYRSCVPRRGKVDHEVMTR
jgi:N-acetylglucosaminyldiphosphoundecaprenol N-acetyl-beta-D-mannosaminyltransferase